MSKAEPKELPNTASEIIPQLDRIESKFSEKMTKLIAGVRRTGKKGTLTLSIDVVPRDKNDDQREILEMSYTIKNKVPEPVSRSTYMHSDDENKLHSQTTLSLASAPSERSPVQELRTERAQVKELPAPKVVSFSDNRKDDDDLMPHSVPSVTP